MKVCVWGVTIMSDEWFEDEEFEEYITDENDPQAVEKITKEDYTISIDNVKIDFDEVFETVRAKITDLTKYDKMMEQKVLDSLRSGKLK